MIEVEGAKAAIVATELFSLGRFLASGTMRIKGVGVGGIRSQHGVGERVSRQLQLRRMGYTKELLLGMVKRYRMDAVGSKDRKCKGNAPLVYCTSFRSSLPNHLSAQTSSTPASQPFSRIRSPLSIPRTLRYQQPDTEKHCSSRGTKGHQCVCAKIRVIKLREAASACVCRSCLRKRLSKRQKGTTQTRGTRFKYYLNLAERLLGAIAH